MRRSPSWIQCNPPSRSQRGLWYVAALLGALWLAPSIAAGATFTATLDRETVTVGETATLMLKFEGGRPKSVPAPPSLPNLQIGNGGISQSFNMGFDGQSSSTISQSYTLTPLQPGEFIIPAFSAEVGGQVLSTPPLKLTAVKAPTTAADGTGDKLAFFRIFVPKKEVYIGEILSAEFQVYMRENLANGEDILQDFERYGGCPLKVEGVSIIKTAHAQRRRGRVGNSIYSVATFVTSLSPLKTGPITLGSIEVPLTLQIPLPNQPRRDPYDPFGMFRRIQVEEKRVSLSAEPETLTALPLPKEGIPPSFNGAVGNFTMTVTAGPTNLAAGDPVTVKVQLTGRGALDSLALPEQNAWHDFKTYPPTTKVETTDPLGLQGTKTFEQVVVPQSADIKALPPVVFSFFNADQKRYQTLTQPAIPLIVRPGGSVPTPVVAATARTAADAPPPTQDIVHIKPRLGVVAQIAPPLVQQGWFLGLQAVPLLAWLSALLWRRRTETLANNPRLRRRRQVAQVIRQGLQDLHRLAAENNSDAFFATLVRLLQEQLGERLDVPASAITEAVIEERLRPRNVPEATLTSLRELFQTCNLARYAPIKSSQELAAMIPNIETVLRDLREVKA
jgi:BatD DUF11 like domain